MTQPPPEEPPNGENPPGYPPAGYPPPPGYPYYPGPPPGYPYGPPPQPKSRIHIGMVFAGVAIYFAINFVIGFAAFAVAGTSTSGDATGIFLGTAVLLALIAFGGGGGLLAVRSPFAKGLGLGLMIGWALTSVFTVGICTGLNPAIYSGL